MAFYKISIRTLKPGHKQTYRQILLVGKNQEQGVAEFVFVQHALQLFPGLDNTVTVIAVNHENDPLRVLEVMSPERTDLVLTTDIPHGKLNVLVLDRLDVETWTDLSASLPPKEHVASTSTRRIPRNPGHHTTTKKH